MKNEAIALDRGEQVQPAATLSRSSGQAMVMGPFPPLISPAAGHASAMLYLLENNGFSVSSAAGPGLSMARHNIEFLSERRLKKSTDFLEHYDAPNLAVLYAKSFEFNRISKPKWYKRRLEELRRLRFLLRVITRFETSAIVFETKPLCSRYQLSLFLVAVWCKLFRGKRVRLFTRNQTADALFFALTGQRRPAPSAHRAEDVAYQAASGSDGSAPHARLTVSRAYRTRQFWAERNQDPAALQIDRDLSQLIAVAKRHDFSHLPQFRLIRELPAHEEIDISGPGQTLYLDRQTYGVPITKYMMHLRAALDLEEQFPLNNKSDAERFLNWYVFEAAGFVADAWVPLPVIVRQYCLARTSALVDFPDSNSQVAAARGRDNNPFPLNYRLAHIASQDKSLIKYDIDDPIDRIALTLETLLSSASGTHATDLIGDSAAQYLSAPIGNDPNCATRIAFLLSVQARCKLVGRDAISEPWYDENLKNWVSNASRKVFPAVASMLPERKSIPKAVPQFTITGLPKSETGVGSNLHMSNAACQAIGLFPQIRDTADGMRKMKMARPQSRPIEVKRSFALHHVNADLIPQTMQSRCFARQPDCYHIGFLLWEFQTLPQEHILAMEMLDEIWTPSRFLRNVYSQATDRPVRNVFKGLHFPQIERRDVPRREGSHSAPTFLTCFDFHSSVARKNPLAAVRAFQKAFPKNSNDASLIIKTTPPVSHHWGDPERQMDKIVELAAHDPRITIIADYVPFNDLIGLIGSVDCLVSPHRAEGFGLMPAYALGLGVPVMATDYSGTRDFCTQKTSFPIACDMVKVGRQQLLHPIEGARWAEIDVDALAGCMREFAHSPKEGLERAERGKALMHGKYSIKKQARRYASILKEIGII